MMISVMLLPFLVTALPLYLYSLEGRKQYVRQFSDRGLVYSLEGPKQHVRLVPFLEGPKQ